METEEVEVEVKLAVTVPEKEEKESPFVVGGFRFWSKAILLAA